VNTSDVHVMVVGQRLLYSLTLSLICMCNVYTPVYANYTAYVCAIYICLQLSYCCEAGFVWSTHNMSNGTEDFTELQNVVIDPQEHG